MSIKELATDLINTPIFPELGAVSVWVLVPLVVVLVVGLVLLWRWSS